MKMLRAGDLCHRVNVMRPALATTTRGQTQGQPEYVRRDWPVSIETISGTEDTEARRNYPTATYKVEGYADPRKPIRETDYLTGGVLGERKLNIGHVADPELKGLKLILLCGETK